MGNMMGAIEAEEEELRMVEKRTEYLEYITYIEDITSEEGLKALAKYQRRYARTFIKAGEEGDDESAAPVSDKNTVFTKLPWEDLERAEDKKLLENYCLSLSKNEDLLVKLEP